MKIQDIITILATFAIGLIAGGYLFLTGFAPQFLAERGVTEATYDNFTIDGEAYGGCLRTNSCPSFQVRSDGSFSYLPTKAGGNSQPLTGTLPTSYMRELKKQLAPEMLEKASQKAPPSSCVSYVDGIDYRYQITIASVIYELNTCGTAFSSTSSLGITFSNLWQSFSSL